MPLSNLADFDFLHLLLMLSQGQKTGALQIERGDERFSCWLEGGRVRGIQLRRRDGSLQQGSAALTAMLQDPQGRFRFDEGALAAMPTLDSPLEPLAYQALAALPDLPLPFEMAAKVPNPERLDLFEWTEAELGLLRRIREQVPLSELTGWEVQVAARLAKLGIVRPRKLRTARLLVTVTHDVSSVVLVDEMIVARWQSDLVRLPRYVGVRDDGGKSYRFPVEGRVGLGALLCIPPDVLTKTRLRGGDSVLVKPL